MSYLKLNVNLSKRVRMTGVFLELARLLLGQPSPLLLGLTQSLESSLTDRSRPYRISRREVSYMEDGAGSSKMEEGSGSTRMAEE